MTEQVLRIFRKDFRRLWPGILGVIALMAAHAVLEVGSEPAVYIPSTERINQAATLVEMLLPLGLWFLIAQMIFQEAIPGDRQFWLTRPYQWMDLLTAKVLFAVVFISLPLFVSDCYILGIQGFAVRGVLPKLLLRASMVAAIYMLPAFAIATITTGLPQFVLAVFIMLLAIISEFLLVSHGSGMAIVVGPGPAMWAYCVIILGGVVIWQYAKRRTNAARWLLLVATFSFLPGTFQISRLPWFRTAQRTLPASPKGLNVRFGYDLGRGEPLERSWQKPPQGLVLASIPLAVTGLPANTLLRGRAEIKIEAGGKPWPESGSVIFGTVKRSGGEYWEQVDLPKAAIKELAQAPVTMHAIFYLNVVNDQAEETIPLSESWFAVPNVGHCHVIQGPIHTSLSCRAGLEEAIETTLRWQSSDADNSVVAEVPPFPTPWGLSPHLKRSRCSSRVRNRKQRSPSFRAGGWRNFRDPLTLQTFH